MRALTVASLVLVVGGLVTPTRAADAPRIADLDWLEGRWFGVKDGTASGQTDDGRYQWTLTIARSTEGEADAAQPIQTAYGLFRIDVVVKWRGSDQRDQSLALATLQLGSIL